MKMLIRCKEGMSIIMKTIAVIGCGRISDIAHFPTLSEIDNVRIKYACDLLIDKAKEKKRKINTLK